MTNRRVSNMRLVSIRALPFILPVEKVWYYTYRGICAAIFVFLVAPIS